MDRRKFCKIGALALGAVGLGVHDARGGAKCVATLPDGDVCSRDCRVTVVRKECYMDLQSLYLDDPETGPCRAFELGEVVELRRGDRRPDRYCPKAWAAVMACVGATQGCAVGCRDIIMAACPDGTRPVIFKIDLL